jgi:hypothetical protein
MLGTRVGQQRLLGGITVNALMTINGPIADQGNLAVS